MSTPTLEELAAEVAELREKFSRERGTWPGPDWMRGIDQTLGTLGGGIMSLQAAHVRSDTMLTEMLLAIRDHTRELKTIRETQQAILSAIEQLGGPGDPGTPG